MVGFRSSKGLLAVLLTVLIGTIMLAIPLLSSSSVHADLTSHAPIYIDGNDNFTLANGVTSGSGYENDPYIIENWDISAGSANGIEIRNTGAYFTIRNCYVHDGLVRYHVGIYFRNVMNGIVDNNIVSNLYSNAIYFDSSDNNTISNNTVENNHFYGISLFFADKNLISNNTCSNNSEGIDLDNSDNNLISNNTIKNNGWGILANYASDNNLIYLNNLMNNATQAVDDGTSYWDNGYPSGGNYWSDYAGVDNYHGENQNIPGGDGICDTSYNIYWGGNMDRYPLMTPWPLIRGLGISISPSSQCGAKGATLTYTVTVNNTGNVSDTYSLTPTDNAGWSPNVLPTSLVLGPEDSDNATLSVTIPPGAIVGTIDNITLVATSQADNTVSYGNNCGARVVYCTGTASIRLATSGAAPFLWGVRQAKVTTNLTVYTGDNLYLRFYVSSSENEGVASEVPIWSRTTLGAQTVIFTNLIVPHDGNLPYPSGNVHKVRLVLKDNSGNIISDNMAWYTPVQDDWGSRIGWIILNWAAHNSSQQDQLGSEISTIILGWSSVPTTRDQYDFLQS